MELRTLIQPTITGRANATPLVINLPPKIQQNISNTTVTKGKEEFKGRQETGKRRAFIEANTKEIGLSHLEQDCIIPVFAKDNESTINHQQFIKAMQQCSQELFGEMPEPEIRVSHIIKGRTPSAIGKPAKELLDHEKTLYYERMAFTLEMPNHSALICGNRLNLTIGGVRAYNHENLYGKKSMERFKVFIGYQNTVCTNLCVSSDGLVEELRAGSVDQLMEEIMQMMKAYNRHDHLTQMETFGEHRLTESQFAQMLGKARLYQFLPPVGKKEIPAMTFHDSHIHAIAKEYYTDPAFRRDSDETIDLWRVYNLFTGANKSSYIDAFLSRTVNAFEFTAGIQQALQGQGGYQWFLR